MVYTADEMAQVFFDYFDEVLGTEWTRHCALDLECLGIRPQDFLALETPFSQEEIWMVIKDLLPDKSLRPDNMTAAFYQAAWSVIKQDVIRAINTFSAIDRRGFLVLMEPSSPSFLRKWMHTNRKITGPSA